MGLILTNSYRFPRLLSASTLMLLAYLLAQPASSPTLEMEVELPVMPDAVTLVSRADVNRKFNFFVYTPFLISDNVTIKPLADFPPSLNVAAPIKWSYTRNGRRLIRFLYALNPKQSGVFELSPFIISNNSNNYQSKAATIVVLHSDEKKESLPLLLSWSPLPKSLYLGESVLISVELRYASVISEAQWKKFPSVNGALFDRLNFGEITHETEIGGQASYRIPLATWLLTPTQEGRVLLSATSLSYLGYNRSLAPQSIEVLALPPTVKQSGAIGDFNLSISLEPKEILPGGSSLLTLRLEGQGNLHYLQLPKPQFEQLKVIKINEQLDARPVSNGYSGSKSVVYRLQQNAVGSYRIRFPPFRWLDANGETRKQQFQPLTFTVSREFKPIFGQSLLANRQLELLRFQFFGVKYGWLLLLIPVIVIPLIIFIFRNRRHYFWYLNIVFLVLWMVAVIFFYYRQNQPNNSVTIQQAQQLFDQGDYRGALSLYQFLILSKPDDPGYRLNQAIILYQLQADIQVLTQLYQVKKMLPSNLLLLDGLSTVKDRMLLANSVDDHYSPFNRINLIIFILLLSYSLLMMLLFGLKRIRWQPLPMAILLLLLITSLLLLFWPKGHYALVGSKNAAVYRIPELSASNFRSLKQGELLKLTGYRNDRYRVLAENGISGWIAQDQLIILES